MAQPSTLETRVSAVMDARRDRSSVGMRPLLASGAAVTLLLITSALAQVAPDVPTPPATPSRSAVLDAAPQIRIEVKIVRVAKGEWAEVKPGKVTLQSKEEAAEALRKMQQDARTKILSSPSIVTRPGERAAIQSGEEAHAPEAGKPPMPIRSMTFEVVSTLKAGAIEMDSTLKLTFPRREGPGTQTRAVHTHFSVGPDQTAIFGRLQDEADDSEVIIFATARTIEAAAVSGAPAANGAENPVLPGVASATTEQGVTVVPRKQPPAPIPVEKPSASTRDVASDPQKPSARPPRASDDPFPVKIDAEEIRTENGITTAKENVALEYKEITIAAQTLSYDPATKTGNAWGKVKWTMPKSEFEMHTEALEFDLVAGEFKTQELTAIAPQPKTKSAEQNAGGK